MIKQLIYNYFEKSKKELKKRDHFSPSDFGKCGRKLYYKNTATEISNPAETHTSIKFEMGNATHEKIMQWLEGINNIKIIQSEQLQEYTYKDIRFTYKPDAIIEIQNKKYVFEIKSTYYSGYKAIQDSAKPEHILQLSGYMIFMGIDNGIILYIGRDNGHIEEYHFTKEDILPIFEAEYIRLSKIQYLIKINQLPKRDFKIVAKKYKNEINFEYTKDKIKYTSDWQCMYCDYFNLCWGDELEKFKKNNNEFMEVVC